MSPPFPIAATTNPRPGDTVQSVRNELIGYIDLLAPNFPVPQSQGGTGNAAGSGLYTALNNSAARSLLSKVQAIAAPTMILSPRAVFTDTARSTIAVNGQLVAGMQDISGSGIVGTQATAAKQPFLRSTGISHSLPGLDFSSSTGKLMTGAGAFAAAAGFSGGFTAYTVAQCPLPPAGTQVLGWGLSASNFYGILNDGTVRGSFNGANVGFIPDLTDLSGVYVASWNGVTGTIGINGRYLSGAAAGSVPVTGDFTVANLAAGGFAWSTGVVGDTWLFPGVHTQAQMDAIGALLAQDSGMALPSFLAIGTSLTLGQGLATPATMNHAAQAFSAIGGNSSNALYKNFGQGGESVVAMIADVAFAPRNRTGYVSIARGTRNTLLVEGSTNDMAASGLDLSAQTALNNMQTLLNLYANSATKIVVETVAPRTASNAGPNFESRRQVYNTGLLNLAANTLNCVVSDVGGPASPIGTVASLSNTALYQGDQIHWTEQGQAVAAEIDAQALAGVSASPFSGAPINVKLAPSGTPDGYGRVVAQAAANALIADYTVGGVDESFLISANVNVTASTLHSFGITCAYTDETNTAQTLNLDFLQLAGTRVALITNTTGVGPYSSSAQHIRCKAGSRIVIASTGTFTTVTYNAEGQITRVD